MKPVLLFGAAGASGAVETLTKAHHDKDGKLSASMRDKIGEVGSKHREDMPADAFLLGAERKYPVKVKRDGGWEYSPDLLLAAARRARMEGRDDLAAEAGKIRARLEDGGNSTSEKSMTKSVLLFGAPGASEAIEALTKAHVAAFTRKDGTFVAEHEDGRAAAQDAPTTESNNKDRGFHEAAYHSHRREKYGPDEDVPNGKQDEARGEADKAFSRVAHELVSAGHFEKHEHARDYLDSRHGRHLGDEIGHKGSAKDVKWLPKSVAKFKTESGLDKPAKK